MSFLEKYAMLSDMHQRDEGGDSMLPGFMRVPEIHVH